MPVQPCPQSFLAENIGPQAITAATVPLAIATLFIGLRLYTHVKITKQVGIDDYVLLVSWSFSLLTTICICIEVSYGMGRHVEAVALDELLKMNQVFFASIIFYSLSAATVKASLLLQYIHIFSLSWVRVACYIILFVVCGRVISAFFATIFTCKPVSYFWDRSKPGGHCINSTALWYSMSAIDISSDVALIAIPIVPLLKLNMPTRQKMTVALLFVLGGFGAITSILRLHSLSVVFSSADVSYNNTSAATWSSVEVNIGAICACLATLRPFATRLFPNICSFKALGTFRDTKAGKAADKDKAAVNADATDEGTELESTMTIGSNAHSPRRHQSDSTTLRTVSSEAGLRKGSTLVGMGRLGEHAEGEEEELEEEEDEELENRVDMYHEYIRKPRRNLVRALSMIRGTSLSNVHEPGKKKEGDAGDMYHKYMRGGGIGRRGTLESIV